MTYDIVGKNLSRIKFAIQKGDYLEAFQIIVETIKLIEPLSEDWSRLINIAKSVIEKIEDPGKRAIAMLDLSEYLREINYTEYLSIRSKVEELIPQVYNRFLAEEIRRRLRKQDLDKERARKTPDFIELIKTKISRIKREIIMNPAAVVELESILIEHGDILSDNDKRELDLLLDKFPPKVEFEAEMLSPEPLILPSRLDYKMILLNKGYRVVEDLKAIVRLESKSGIEEKTIDPIPGQRLRLRPNESKITRLRVPVEAPGEYKVYVNFEYYDALGKRYRTEPRQVGEVTAIILTVSEAFKKGQSDEFYTTRAKLVSKIDDVFEEIVKLYEKFSEGRKINEEKLVDDLNRLFRWLIFNKLEGELLDNLKKVREAYSRSLGECRDINQFYENTFSNIKSKIEKLIADKEDALRYEKRGLSRSGTLTLREEIHGALGDIIRELVKVKWIEDGDKLEKLIVRLKEIKNIGSHDEVIRGERHTVFLLLVTKTNFNQRHIIEVKNIMEGGPAIKGRLEYLESIADQVINSLEELRVEWRCR